MRKALAIVVLAVLAGMPAAWSQGLSSFFEDKMADAVKAGSLQDAREALLKGANPNSKGGSEFLYLIEALIEKSNYIRIKGVAGRRLER